jgi:leucyl/phenylalanyl-tRNA--protein transferase
MNAHDAKLVEGLLEAYRLGFFPMADPRTGRVEFFSPDPRAIIPIDAPPGTPGGLVVPRSLRARVRSGRFRIVSDSAFEQVIDACAQPRDGPEQDGSSWIDERIRHAYTALHRAGFAHSVEAWLPGEPGQPDRLVGGLYGVHLGGAFFGESMFSRPAQGGTDASKVCLVHLVHHLRARGFRLLDTQFRNDHIARFGLVEIPRDEYLRQLADALAHPADWTTPAGSTTPHAPYAPAPPS